MRILTIETAAVLGFLAGSAGAYETVMFDQAKLFEVTADKLNVRSQHAKDASIVKVLDKHQALQVVGKWGDNWKLISSPVKGWVHSDYVRFGLKRFVKADSLNVRYSPSTTSGVKARLKKGAEVRVVEKKGDWRRIDQPTSGWCHADYLAVSKPGDNLGPTSSAGFVQLPSSATGLYWYCSYSSHHWGVPRLISKILTMGRKWSPRRIGSGDISLPQGGYFSPHSTHRDGRAADFQPMTTSGSGGATAVGYSSYSTYYTQLFVNLMYNTETRVSFILHNNSSIRGVQYSSGHHNHLHLYVY